MQVNGEATAFIGYSFRFDKIHVITVIQVTTLSIDGTQGNRGGYWGEAYTVRDAETGKSATKL